MGYLGTKPANQIIDSALIADGTVTTSDLASGLTVNFADGSASAPSITNDGDTNTGIFFPAADTIAFAEGGAEVARFDSSGNLGIGTSSPAQRLDVNGSVGMNGTMSIKSSGTTVGFFGDVDGTSNVQLRSQNAIEFKSGGNNERMRIDSSGNLLVGVTTADGKLSVEQVGNVITAKQLAAGGWCYKSNAFNNSGTRYQIEFLSDGNAAGSITSGASTTTYGTTSDYRLKENVAPMTGALATVAQLKPVTYTWKIDGEKGQGFIAHELQAVVPDCVQGKKDAVDAEGKPVYQGIDTSFLVATLTAAIQEQQAIITEQSLALQDLKARIETLENK